jgi:hypothetical protein
MSGRDPGDFQSTLNELERKLRDLLSELVSPPDKQPQAPEEPPGPPPMPPYRPPASTEPPAQPAAAGGLQGPLEELLRFRDQLAQAAKALVEDYSRLLEQIERAMASPSPSPPPPPPPPPPPTPASGHVTFPVPPPAAPPTESTLYSGHIAIDAGPFADIATLAAFEDALRHVPHAEDVYVRSFEAHRALLEVRLAAEVPLVFELRRASDQAFDVDHADPGRLTLTMHAGNLPFPMRPANEHEAPPVPPANGGETD